MGRKLSGMGKLKGRIFNGKVAVTINYAEMQMVAYENFAVIVKYIGCTEVHLHVTEGQINNALLFMSEGPDYGIYAVDDQETLISLIQCPSTRGLTE